MKTEIKTFTDMSAQGDVLFRRVPAVPASFTKKDVDGPIIVAHSETGHHHVVSPDGVTFYENMADPLICYLQMNVDVCSFDVQHMRSFDTHHTLRAKGEPGSVWEVRRQKEHAPEGWRRAQD